MYNNICNGNRNDQGNATLVRGVEGPVVRGSFNKWLGRRSTLIHGRVDDVEFEFKVIVVCKKGNRSLVCILFGCNRYQLMFITR